MTQEEKINYINVMAGETVSENLCFAFLKPLLYPSNTNHYNVNLHYGTTRKWERKGKPYTLKTALTDDMIQQVKKTYSEK